MPTDADASPPQQPACDGVAAAQAAAAPGQEVLQGAATMEQAYDLLAARIQRRLAARGSDRCAGGLLPTAGY